MRVCTLALRPRLCSTLASLALTTACEPTPEFDPRASQIGTVDLEIGVHGVGEDSPGFGLVSGLAIDSAGRVVVSDAQYVSVFLYTGAGEFAQALLPHRPPGIPCCVTWYRGLLWVLDRQTNSYDAYAITNTGSLHREQFVPLSPATWLSSRISFDSIGRLVHVSDGRLALAGPRVIRRLVAPLPALSRVDTLPAVSSPDLKWSRFLASSGQDITLFQQPFGAEPLHAFGPKGEYAFAVSSQYEVFLWSADLGEPRVLTQSLAPVPLSWAERRLAKRTLAEIAKRQRLAIGDLPFGVPDHRPTLHHLMFDLSGHLWVVRSVREGYPHLADVYDADGRLVAIATWPAEVSLELGAIRDSVALGTVEGADGTQRVVRLRFRPRPAMAASPLSRSSPLERSRSRS